MTKPLASSTGTAIRHLAGRDAVAWLQPDPDGTVTLYAIRPGQPTLIVAGLNLRFSPPAPPSSASPGGFRS